MTEAVLYDVDERLPQSVILDTGEDQLLEVYAKASTSTDFSLDCSVDNKVWHLDYYVQEGATVWKKGFFNTWRYVRLRSKAAGSAGDKVTLILISRRM